MLKTKFLTGVIGCNVFIITYYCLQRNEAGNSQGMEYLAFQRCLDFLAESDFPFEALVTDRHGSITKHMKEKEQKIKHFFDL